MLFRSSDNFNEELENISIIFDGESATIVSRDAANNISTSPYQIIIKDGIYLTTFDNYNGELENISIIFDGESATILNRNANNNIPTISTENSTYDNVTEDGGINIDSNGLENTEGFFKKLKKVFTPLKTVYFITEGFTGTVIALTELAA